MKYRRKIERLKERLNQAKYEQKATEVPDWLRKNLDEKIEQERKIRAGRGK